MLEMNPEIVCTIIDKLHEFHVKEEVVIPEVPDSPTDDWAMQVMADHKDDLTYQELDIIIKDLEPDQKQTLLALMWLGRGDYSIEEWENALNDVTGDYINNMEAQFIAIPFVADYLQEGLSLHDYTCE